MVEFAWSLSASLKVKDNVGKWILRQVLYKYVSREMIERPKMGFGVPVGEWIKGPLKEWAEEMLSEKKLVENGIPFAREIRACWKQHLNGQINRRDPLWTVLMWQSWMERNN